MTTYVDDILFNGNGDNEVDRMVRCSFGNFQERDLGAREKPIEIHLKVIEDGVVLDQVRFTEVRVVEGMGSTDVRELHSPFDPGMNLAVRQDEEELEESPFRMRGSLGS